MEGVTPVIAADESTEVYVVAVKNRICKSDKIIFLVYFLCVIQCMFKSPLFINTGS